MSKLSRSTKPSKTFLTGPVRVNPVDFACRQSPSTVSVYPCENIAAVDVEGLGRALRLSDAFAPNGTNVDFVQFIPAHKALIRTYERGVEAESGACGTGAVATAVVAVETKKMSLPVHVRTSQGYTLTVDGDWRHAKSTGFTLTGPVKKVFEGVVDLDSFDTGNEME